MSEVRVVKFGCHRLTSGEDLALIEMRRASQYYNALVSIEQWRRKEYAAIRSRYVPGLSEMEAADEQITVWLEEQRDSIRDKRRRASVKSVSPRKILPTKRVDATEEIDEIAELKKWQKELRARLKPARAAFAALLLTASDEYKRRTGAAPKGDNHAKKRLNASVRADMLDEPEWSPAWKDTARADAVAYDLREWAFHGSGLNHGTYVSVRDAVAQAGKRPKPRPDGQPRRPKTRPAFSRRMYRKIGWQLHGVTVADVLAGNSNHFRFTNVQSARTSVGKKNPQNHSPEELAKRARAGAGKGNRSRMNYALAQIRIGSTEDRAPIWTEAQVFLHRPIPNDALVRWIYLVPSEEVRRLKSGKLVPASYTLQLTVETAAPLIQRAPGTGTVEVRLGWSKTPDGGLTVARLSNGATVVLPKEVISNLEFSMSLRGDSDRYFDVARDALCARLVSLPEWTVEAAATAAHWRAHGKLAYVAERLATEVVGAEKIRLLWADWKAYRATLREAYGSEAGDLHASLEVVSEWLSSKGELSTAVHFATWLEWWRRKDRHLKELETNTRRRALNRRLDLYRCTAARLSTEFEKIEILPLDLEAAALRDMPEVTPKELHEAARRQRFQAATSELKLALKNAFGPRYCERSGDDEDPGPSRDSEKTATEGGLSAAEAHAAE